MSYPEAIISGIVQGLTEFLPVSSSGHLVILHHYFGYKKPQLFFDIFLHLGTLFAILIYFRHDIIEAVTKQRRLLWLVLIGSIPAAIIGFMFKDLFEAFFNDVKMAALMLFVTAGFLFTADLIEKSRDKNASPASKLGWIKALLIGAVQAIAIIPGISRSGSTVASGLILKLDKEEAVRFSFLLAIPAIIGASILKIADNKVRLLITPVMAIGAFFAFLVGLAGIHIFIRTVLTCRLRVFWIYCLVAGGAVLVLG